MRYSIGFKESVIRQVLPPSNKSIPEVSRETGVSDQTIRNWLKQSKDGSLDKSDTVGGLNRSSREKFNLILQSKTVSEDDKGIWLRENGLHSEHINQYEQDIRDLVENNGKSEKEELRKLRKENKELAKELRKKEKALAEMAALYTLKKKADALWGDGEED